MASEGLSRLLSNEQAYKLELARRKEQAIKQFIDKIGITLQEHLAKIHHALNIESGDVYVGIDDLSLGRVQKAQRDQVISALTGGGGAHTTHPALDVRQNGPCLRIILGSHSDNRHTYVGVVALFFPEASLGQFVGPIDVWESAGKEIVMLSEASMVEMENWLESDVSPLIQRSLEKLASSG